MKSMIKALAIIAILMSCVACNSLGGDSKLMSERDSLLKENDEQADKIFNYAQTINLINATLDSIAHQESILFVSNGDLPLTKSDVKQNLARFQELLKKQELEISKLQSRLATSKDSTQSAVKLIARLKEQIALKNGQIEKLNEELDKKNVSIAELQKQVGAQRTTIESQSATIDELTDRNQKQTEALARQDAMLNNGYVLIGTGNQLKELGVIKKGKLVANGVLDRSRFRKIDIRNCREFTFEAKKPRILTNMPSSTYELTTNGNKTFTLHIKQPSDFWKITRYLVIQTD